MVNCKFYGMQEKFDKVFFRSLSRFLGKWKERHLQTNDQDKNKTGNKLAFIRKW